ncbi:hypothetical protein JTB14_035623, partial [Gonioctena quinquepunctata]
SLKTCLLDDEVSLATGSLAGTDQGSLVQGSGEDGFQPNKCLSVPICDCCGEYQMGCDFFGASEKLKDALDPRLHNSIII